MVFGAGGGTNSYQEIEETDVILLWGSNARETHPIFFHRLLKGVRNGARLYAIDPRRTSSVQWADMWAGLDVGTDIALANAIAREIIAAGLEHREFIENATTGFDEYRRSVEPYTLEHVERETGVPAHVIRDMAHTYARAHRAMICWTLGITEHHNAVDNVLALINLALLTSLDFLVAQDMFLTKTAELADVVLPASAAWCETEGTVTNSERRVQRVRKALDAPAGARDDIAILYDVARRMGHDLGQPIAENIWNEVRLLSPAHAGMSYTRLEALKGLQWPCYDENHPGELYLHSRLWERPLRGPRVSFIPVEHDPPVDKLSPEFPLRLTTGRRLDEYNTGVQTSAYSSPLRRGETLDLSPEDAERLGVTDGELVRVHSRRGSVTVPVRRDRSLRPGLTFMTLHFPDDVATNLLTIDATDPKSGTAEFKAAAVRVEKV